MQRQIMYPSEREAISNAVVRKILLPDEEDHQHFKLNNLMDENFIQNIFKRTWSKTLTTIGDLMSAALGLWLICKVVKFIIESILHAYELHGVYGFGWQILLMFYDALTYICF